MKWLQKAERKFIKQCHLYLPRNGDTALIAATFNHGGLFAEKPEAVAGCDAALSEELGNAIKKKLNECEYRLEFNYSGQKRSDWPAFKRSGSKTIQAFEDSHIQYLIRGVNDTNITLQINSLELQNNIQLQATISAMASTEEIGKWVRKFHDFFLKVERVT